MSKKTSIMLALILLLALTLTACGGGITPPANNVETPPAGDTPPAASPSGEIFQFNLQNHDSPNGATAKFLDAWAAAIKEESGGRIIINNFHGGSMGGPKDTYNMVINGTVDFGWGLPSFYPGRFPATDAIALPFIGVQTSLQASYALWDLYNSTDYLKGEWSEVQVILLHTNCDAPLITKDKKVTKVEDLKGMKLRVNGGPPTEFAKLAGANPMNIGIGDVYSSQEKGVVNGVTSTGWDVVSAFKLYEQGNYFLDYAIHVNPYFLVMNKNSYAKLPDDLKSIIDKYSGYGALEIVGNRWAQVKDSVFEAIAAKGGEIYTLSDTEQAKFDDLGSKARESWMADLDKQGINAQDLVTKTLALLEKYKDK